MTGARAALATDAPVCSAATRPAACGLRSSALAQCGPTPNATSSATHAACAAMCARSGRRHSSAENSSRPACVPIRACETLSSRVPRPVAGPGTMASRTEVSKLTGSATRKMRSAASAGVRRLA